jgi:hypothetical protein
VERLKQPGSRCSKLPYLKTMEMSIAAWVILHGTERIRSKGLRFPRKEVFRHRVDLPAFDPKFRSYTPYADLRTCGSPKYDHNKTRVQSSRLGNRWDTATVGIIAPMPTNLVSFCQ